MEGCFREEVCCMVVIWGLERNAMLFRDRFTKVESLDRNCFWLLFLAKAHGHFRNLSLAILLKRLSCVYVVTFFGLFFIFHSFLLSRIFILRSLYFVFNHLMIFRNGVFRFFLRAHFFSEFLYPCYKGTGFVMVTIMMYHESIKDFKNLIDILIAL